MHVLHTFCAPYHIQSGGLIHSSHKWLWNVAVFLKQSGMCTFVAILWHGKVGSFVKKEMETFLKGWTGNGHLYEGGGDLYEGDE